MSSIEVTASSLDDARSMAANQLGVSPDEVDLEVLEESPGLFGRKKLRVKATVGGSSAPAEDKRPAKPAAKRAPKKAAKPEPVEEEEAAEEAAPEPKPARRTRTAAKAKESTEDKSQSSEDADDAEAPEVLATEEDAEQILEIMNEILDAGDFDAEVTVASLTGKYVNLELDGRDVSYLVGKRGEVLNALQYLMNVILTRQFSNGVRVTVEGNNYRRRREEVLSKLALDIAEEVRNRGEEAVLDALPAFERRVVHRALVDFDGVKTYSEGEEPERRVVIAPA